MEDGTPRLYLIETLSGELQQNLAHLTIRNLQENQRTPLPQLNSLSLPTHSLSLAQRQEQSSISQIVNYMSQGLKRGGVTCRYI